MKQTAQIFLCYAHQDEAKVKALYQILKDAGFKPWMDTFDLIGGEKWQSVIQQTIPNSDFFIACLSKNSISKRGFLQRELSIALEALRERLENDIYIIPVRLEECDVPESLSLFQWVDYFREDGWERLVKSIHKGMDRLGIIKPVRLRSQPTDHLVQYQAVKMLIEKKFYDERMNTQGKGILHQYELFECHGEKLVIDHTTALIWQQSGSDRLMSFPAAKEYVDKLNQLRIANYDDWRLPTLEEAMSLMEPERINGVHINPIFDITNHAGGIWTADERENSESAWIFGYGNGGCYDFDKYTIVGVRAVRSAT